MKKGHRKRSEVAIIQYNFFINVDTVCVEGWLGVEL